MRRFTLGLVLGFLTKLYPEANFIVGFAAVRRPTGVSWRTILELPPPAELM